MENSGKEMLSLFKEIIQEGSGDELYEMVKENKLGESGIRWNAWQVFLGVFEGGEFDLAKKRDCYRKRKQEILEYFHELQEEAELNPLMIEKVEVCTGRGWNENFSQYFFFGFS